MSGNGRDALAVVRESSAVQPGCPGVVGRPSRMSGSGWEDLPGDQEAFPNVWEWSGDLPGSSGVVRSPSRRSESGQKALPDVREWSAVPP